MCINYIKIGKNNKGGNLNKKKTKRQNGITLVALVVTIIILLILATISIQSLTNTGLFKKAQEAKEKTQNATENQAKTLNEYEDELNKYISGTISKQPVKKVEDNIGNVLSTTDNTELQDAYGNKIVVPAGFKIVSNSDTNNATTVDKGIVIEDVTLGATAGSQFVWIPVGKIYTDIAKTDANAKTIELGRYEFDSNGNKSAYSGSYVEEDKGDTNTTLKNYGNTIAKISQTLKIV
jgi:type II secretory pathway pseudopilin PulG